MLKYPLYFSNMILLLTFFFSTPSQAQSFQATITQLKGDVKILKPYKPGSSKVLRYKGVTYNYKRARLGRKLKPKQILLNGPNGQAKIVYNNGDHLVIGPGSAIEMPSRSSKTKGKTSKIKLFYGKFRALISKKGPRNKLIIKTPSAVAGVRGTDFFISDSGTSGTNLTVMRGKVAVAKNKKRATKSAERALKKAIIIKKGFTAQVGKEQPEKPPETYIKPQKAMAISDSKELPDILPSAVRKSKKESDTANDIVVLPVTKEELIDVQATTAIAPSEIKPTPLNENIKSEIKQLQKKSAEIILADIKEDDPTLYKKLKDKKNSKSINTAVVAKLFKKAPREKVKRKLSSEALEALDKDIYKKYFNIKD